MSLRAATSVRRESRCRLSHDRLVHQRLVTALLRGRVLVEAEETDGIVVSVATLIDLWYVTQTTKAVTTDDLARLRTILEASSTVTLQPITLDVVDACTAIQRELLADPWDRLIVATAKALGVALVTRDRAIQKAELVPTVW